MIRLNRLILIVIATLFAISAFSQNWDAVKADPQYLYGEGYGSTVKEADNAALEALISKIGVSVSSSSTLQSSDKMTNGKLDSKSDFQHMMKTYSQATLTNTERALLQNEPDAHVGRWIKRSEIEKIFESRKLKINDLVESALKAEERGKADDALRCYYWALALVQSLQRPNEAVFTDDNGKKHMLAVWLPEQINSVLADLKATVEKVNGSDVDLLITYKGKPVTSVDYTYFDGRDWSNIYSAKDGRGVLELASGNVSDHFQVKYEYEYRGESHIDKEVQSVLTSLKPIPIRDAYVDVKQTNNSALKTIQQSFQPTEALLKKTSASLSKPVEGYSQYVKVMDKVTKAIISKNYGAVSDFFTPNGKDVYQKLIHYGNARILGTPKYTFYQDGNDVVGRGAQMSFSFKTGLRKAFVEDVVFTFNSAGKIDNIAFGMGKTAETDILCKGAWAEAARKAIMDFMENYKTAYALKRLDYIKGVFDDDAVIITGNVAKKMTLNRNGDGPATVTNNKIITYNRQTKDEYIRNLAKCFASNEFINIRFANNDVYKLARGGELYGIQIAQDYYSSNYGDKGYLFLMVDINDPKQPIIKVRTWQPEKDPNFGLYGPGDF